MNNLLYLIVLILALILVVKIYKIIEEKAPLIEKFIEEPFAKFKKYGNHNTQHEEHEVEEEHTFFSKDEYNLPVNYEIKKILSNYLKSNENCEIGQSDLYYRIFVTSLRNYIKYNFIKTLGYIPDNDLLDITDTREYRIYKKIVNSIPDCYDLMKNFLKIDINELDVQHSGNQVGKHSKTVKKLNMYSGNEYADYNQKDNHSKKKGYMHQFTQIFKDTYDLSKDIDKDTDLKNTENDTEEESKKDNKKDNQKEILSSSLIHKLAHGGK